MVKGNLSSSMQRYFADLINNEVILSKDDIFHLTKVMRCKIGEHIEIINNATHLAYFAVIDSINPLKIHVQEPILKESELDKNVTLFFALAKSDKNEFVIQKATELGVRKIVLFEGKRSVVKLSKEDFKKKEARYINIAKEASEQCHRLYIPEIVYVDSVKGVKEHLEDLNLFAYELEAGRASDISSNINTAKSISVIIGPEGGFDDSEVSFLKELDFKTISLGKRILRCETAAIYALSVISYLLEK